MTTSFKPALGRKLAKAAAEVAGWSEWEIRATLHELGEDENADAAVARRRSARTPAGG
jgi:hypothetical protein